ncbi:MAG TPA: hypothetical protein VIG08_06085 [Gemmatimonadales bacterium]|jgi:hypothetical protein
MSRFAPAVLTTFAVLTAACSDGGGPTSDPQINFNLATRGAAASAAGASLAVLAPETFTDGTHTLVIDQVDLVLREIELKRSEATVDCGDSPNDDACEKLELGPVLLSLPLGTGGAARAFSVTVSPGTYDEVEFEIHAPSSSDDAAFLQANPDFAGVSIHVAGSYDGTPFDFVSDLTAEEEIHLSPALTVAESAATELTLFVDLDSWFRDAGGLLVDPQTAADGQANESMVQDNIRRALDVFEDEDHDGQHDDGEHHQNGDDNGGNLDGPNHT